MTDLDAGTVLEEAAKVLTMALEDDVLFVHLPHTGPHFCIPSRGGNFLCFFHTPPVNRIHIIPYNHPIYIGQNTDNTDAEFLETIIGSESMSEHLGSGMFDFIMKNPLFGKTWEEIVMTGRMVEWT